MSKLRSERRTIGPRYGVFRAGPGSLAPLAGHMSRTEAVRFASHLLRDGYDEIVIRKVRP